MTKQIKIEFSPSNFLSALKKLQKTIGNELYQAWAANLPEYVYEYALKEDVERCIKVNTEMTIIKNGVAISVKVFDVNEKRNGFAAIYHIAKRASKEKRYDVIDFLEKHMGPLNAKAIVAAYAENNDVDAVNELLEKNKKNNDTDTENQLPENNSRFKKLVLEAVSGYEKSGNQNEIDSFKKKFPTIFEKPKEILLKGTMSHTVVTIRDSLIAFYNKMTSICRYNADLEAKSIQDLLNGLDNHLYSDAIIYACSVLAYYNHSILLRHFLKKSRELSYTNVKICHLVALDAAIYGGSSEAIGVVTLNNANLAHCLNNLLKNKHYLVLEKMLEIGEKSCYFKKLPLSSEKKVIKRPDEAPVREALIAGVSDYFNTIKAAHDKTCKVYEVNSSGKYEKATEDLNILKLFKNSSNPDSEILLKSWIELLKSNKYSLIELLNRPLKQLGFASHYDLNIVQHMIFLESNFLYINMLLSAAPKILNFWEADTLNVAVSIPAKEVFSSVLIRLIHSRLAEESVVMSRDFANLIDPSEFFNEIYLFDEELKTEKIIEHFKSSAIKMLSINEKTCQYVINHFKEQLTFYLDNPFILHQLLEKDAGLAWIFDNINMLKNVSLATFEFGLLDDFLFSNNKLRGLILERKDILSLLSEKTQHKFNEHKRVTLLKKNEILKNQSKNVKAFFEQTKLAPVAEKYSLSQLRDVIKKCKYIEKIDFDIKPVNNKNKKSKNKKSKNKKNNNAADIGDDIFQLIFASLDKNSLSNIEKIFNDPNLCGQVMTEQGSIHQLVLTFSLLNLGRLVKVFQDSPRKLEKIDSYDGAIKKLDVKTSCKVESSKKAIDKDNWMKGIRQAFCYADKIVLSEQTNHQKTSYIITYTDSGQKWKLKESSDAEPVEMFVTDANVRQIFFDTLLNHLTNKKLGTASLVKNKITIKPTANQIGDLSSIQKTNFTALIPFHEKRELFVTYGAAGEKIELPEKYRTVFLKFYEAFEKFGIKAKIVERDSFVSRCVLGNFDSPRDRDIVTTCENEEVYRHLKLQKSQKAKITLYSGYIGSEWVDVVVMPDSADWALKVAMSADITSCSLQLVSPVVGGNFYLLDMLERGRLDVRNGMIVPTSFENLDKKISDDPIRIIRAIKFLVRENAIKFSVKEESIDPKLRAAILRWKAISYDKNHFTEKLLDVMKNRFTRSIDVDDAATRLWILHLESFGVLKKVYGLNVKCSVKDSVNKIRSCLPESTSEKKASMKLFDATSIPQQQLENGRTEPLRESMWLGY